jgi:hypothetical protein
MLAACPFIEELGAKLERKTLIRAVLLRESAGHAASAARRPTRGGRTTAAPPDPAG